MRASVKAFVGVFAAVVLSVGGYAGYESYTGNFHAVTPGEAYRSAHLDSEQLEHYVKKHDIRSILNVRGKKSDPAAYESEVRAASELGLAYYYVPLVASEAPSPDEIRQLLEIFKNAPRPILIHCKAGADRSGLVAAMWKSVVDKEPKSTAKKQLSILYGHIPLGRTSALDRFFENWEPPQ